MKFLVKFPTRSRRQIFEMVLRKWLHKASPWHEIFWMFTLDTDDEQMQGWQSPIENSKVYWGESKSKIDAVNRDMELAPDFEVLVLASDDMVPRLDNWDDQIMRQMETLCCDVLHQNDGIQGEKLNTLSIMTKSIYNRLGYIYHPDYFSLFADNEFTEVTKGWDVSRYTGEIIIQHQWQHLTGMDMLHQRNSTNEVWQRDQLVWQERRKRGYPKESILKELGL